MFLDISPKFIWNFFFVIHDSKGIGLDISPKFIWNPYDTSVAKKIIEFEETPEQIKYFAGICDNLTDYAYWFFLSTCWVSYTGYTDINLWRRLFSSSRQSKKTSIMKPTELKAFEYLPYFVTAYRAHRPEETDWIAYTLDIKIACRFARERNVDRISEYRIKKKDITALFLRRGEKEVIVLDKDKAQLIREIHSKYFYGGRSE